jgi:hypothetical protein
VNSPRDTSRALNMRGISEQVPRESFRHLAARRIACAEDKDLPFHCIPPWTCQIVVTRYSNHLEMTDLFLIKHIIDPINWTTG